MRFFFSTFQLCNAVKLCHSSHFLNNEDVVQDVKMLELSNMMVIILSSLVRLWSVTNFK